MGSEEEETEYLNKLKLAATIITTRVEKANTGRNDIELRPRLEELTRFLEITRIIHQHVWDEWERFHGCQGLPNRPYKTLKENYGEKNTVIYDYGEKRSLEDWHNDWKENYSRQGARNPGTFRPPLQAWPKAPLDAVYDRLNQWWITVLDKRFWPDYSLVLGSKDDEENALPDLGAAACMFYLVAQQIDSKYSLLHCKRVHDDGYRFLKHKKA